MQILLENYQWQGLLKAAVENYIRDLAGDKVSRVHVEDTPQRVVRAFAEYASGYMEDPAEPLRKTFVGDYDEMVHVGHIRIVSTCAHHIAPILGLANFAYIPRGRVVGLSKIPRFISILSRRLQIQEEFSNQIVDVFQDTVNPAGCAVSIKAYHCCMLARGVREHETYTTTTALRGVLKTDLGTKAEFLHSLNNAESIFG